LVAVRRLGGGLRCLNSLFFDALHTIAATINLIVPCCQAVVSVLESEVSGMRMLRLLMVVDRCVYFYQDQLSRERESRGAVQHVLAADKQTLRRRSFYPGNNVCTRCLASPKHVSAIPPLPDPISSPSRCRLVCT